MMDIVWHVITPLITALLGAGGATAFASAYWAHSRQKILDSQSIMHDLYENLKERLSIVEASEKECVEAKERLSSDVGRLTAEVEALRQQLQQYIEPQVPISIRADHTGKILSINGPIEQTLGFKPADLVGKQIENLMPPYARVAHRLAFAEAAATDSPELRNVTLRDTFTLTKWGNKPVTIVLNSSMEDGHKVFDAELYVVKFSKQ